MTSTDPAPPHRRLSIQVWANDRGGYTGYCPQTDTEADHPDFEGARRAALAKALASKEVTMRIEPAPTWRCVNGHDNPDGRTDCCVCGNPIL